MYRVLIVEDELAIRYGLRHYFSWNQIGFEVVGDCANGRQALDYCRNSEIDVVLTDIKMPIMDGLEFAREIKRQGLKIKIVLLSGYREFEFAREALKYDIKNYIVKPTKYEELCEVFSGIKGELDKERGVAPYQYGESHTCSHSYYEKVVSVVKSYIYDNYQNASLEKAGQLVHFNSNYLSKIFKEVTGENFSDFLLKARMEKAASLLSDVQYKTYQISELVGYSNPKNFARTFKKHYGVSPKEFRDSIL